MTQARRGGVGGGVLGRALRPAFALLWLLAVIAALTGSDVAFFLSLPAAVLLLHFDDPLEVGSHAALPLLRRLGLELLARDAVRTRQRSSSRRPGTERTLLVTPRSSRIPVVRHGAAARIRLGFGLLDEPGGGAARPCATVELRVAATDGYDVLWARRLARHPAPAEPGPQAADVELGADGDVVVEVAPPDRDCASTAYWSGVTSVP